jgi:hypothetical protein
MIVVKGGGADDAYAFDEVELKIETVGDLVRAVDEASRGALSARDATFLSRKRRFRGDECDLDVRAMVDECKGRVLKVMMVRSAAQSRNVATGGTSRGVEALRASRLAKAEAAAASKKQPQRCLNEMEARQKAWHATGVVGLRGVALVDVPPEVYALGERARVLDVASNALESLSCNALGTLVNMTRLVLRDNALGALPWSAFETLSALTFLDVSGNALESLPSCDDADVASPPPSFAALESLSLARNKLKRIPDGFFTRAPKLRHFSVANNALEELFPRAPPPRAIEYVDASSNRIRRVSETFASLPRLQSLVLDGNAIDIDGVPSAVLLRAEALVELSLHNNPVKLDALRDIDGWDAFDARRKARANKALESRVMLGSSVFDEGADSQRFVRH